MITSITDIQNYKRCRRRWDYSSSLRGNLTGIGVGKPALELGSLIHAALAAWTTDPNGEQKVDNITIKKLGGSEPVPVSYFIYFSNKRIDEIATQYLQRIGVGPSDEELAPLYESIDLGVNMIRNYHTRWNSPLPKNFKFAVPEQEIVVDIPGTEHYCDTCIDYCNNNNILPLHTDTTVGPVNPQCTECNGTGTAVHKLRCILDGIIQNDKGQFFILERKTYGSRPRIESLETNDQFIGYIWASMQVGIKPLMGIAYDGLWKRKSPPRGSKLEDLFARTIIRFSTGEIEDWGIQLAAVVNEMASNPPIYPNRRWEGCNDCAFERLCTMQSRGEDYQSYIKNAYTQRENTKPVLT